MKSIRRQIAEEVCKVFAAHGLDESYAKVSVSNRPDLCDYQCNGAMAAAKVLHKAPIAIAEEIVASLADCPLLEEAEAVKPGFINLTVAKDLLVSSLEKMDHEEQLGYEKTSAPKTVIMDYGGPNVAKPLHVGHLRAAIIGESLKRIWRFVGENVISDIHLGDWGLQMGLIVTELAGRQPDLVYFDEDYTGEYPKEAPFTISELEEIYPTASAKSKVDKDYYSRALAATKEMQDGRRGYQALLSHIMNVSVTDLKKNYDRLSVSFDLWKGEADAAEYIPGMVEQMKADGFAYVSEGALVVDVAEEGDTKEIPPCMILKSDGAALYDTTDLATLVWRERDYHPDSVIYVVDKRQEMHFVQVFRCAKKTGIVPQETELYFLGFGTMNGKDGKPFKTREGGVMRLSELISDINDKMYEKIIENQTMTEEEARQTAEIVGLAAIKYGDLSNQPSKDYVFDVDRFTSFEGNTGPYILYSIVRIGSILRKYHEAGGDEAAYAIRTPENDSERDLMLQTVRFSEAIDGAYREYAPNRLCAYIYELCNAFNHFYHETRILAIEDEAKKGSYVRLLSLVRDVLLTSIDLLGFSAPEKM